MLRVVLAQLYSSETGSQECVNRELEQVQLELRRWLEHVSQRDESEGPCLVWLGLIPDGGWVDLLPSAAQLRLDSLDDVQSAA
jgi:hypothetical protein